MKWFAPFNDKNGIILAGLSVIMECIRERQEMYSDETYAQAMEPSMPGPLRRYMGRKPATPEEIKEISEAREEARDMIEESLGKLHKYAGEITALQQQLSDNFSSVNHARIVELLDNALIGISMENSRLIDMNVITGFEEDGEKIEIKPFGEVVTDTEKVQTLSRALRAYHVGTAIALMFDDDDITL